MPNINYDELSKKVIYLDPETDKEVWSLYNKWTEKHGYTPYSVFVGGLIKNHMEKRKEDSSKK